MAYFLMTALAKGKGSWEKRETTYSDVASAHDQAMNTKAS